MSLIYKKPLKVFGVKLKNKEKIMQSQSGGAFAAIAEYFLSNGAVVYGCSLNTELEAVYSRITSIDELDTIKGSKYVQASVGNAIKNVMNDLQSGKTVLFSGTPCYVAAIKQYASMKKYEDQLFTVDIICHGVPSPLVYKNYLSELRKKEKSDIVKYIFRDKIQGGWRRHVERIVYSNGKEEISEDYIKLFYTNLPLRPACGKCKFSKIERISDFTIGDFWGVQNSFPEFNDDRGVSILFCNNERAVNLFNEISSFFETLETDIEHAMQPNLKGPSKVPVYRKLFWRDFYKHGVLYCSKKWPPIVEFPIALKGKLRKIIKGK